MSSDDFSAPKSFDTAGFEVSLKPHLKFLEHMALRLAQDQFEADFLLKNFLQTLYLNRALLPRGPLSKAWLARVMYQRFKDRRSQDDLADSALERLQRLNPVLYLACSALLYSTPGRAVRLEDHQGRKQ